MDRRSTRLHHAQAPQHQVREAPRRQDSKLYTAQATGCPLYQPPQLHIEQHRDKGSQRPPVLGGNSAAEDTVRCQVGNGVGRPLSRQPWGREAAVSPRGAVGAGMGGPACGVGAGREVWADPLLRLPRPQRRATRRGAATAGTSPGWRIRTLLRTSWRSAAAAAGQQAPGQRLAEMPARACQRQSTPMSGPRLRTGLARPPGARGAWCGV